MSRGRQATSPTKIPQAGWIDILWRVKSRESDDRVSLLAAGIAFYALLALFPAIAALLAIGGLVMDPPQIIEQMTRFAGVVPSDVLSIIEDQATAVTGSSDSGSGPDGGRKRGACIVVVVTRHGQLGSGPEYRI